MFAYFLLGIRLLKPWQICCDLRGVVYSRLQVFWFMNQCCTKLKLKIRLLKFLDMLWSILLHVWPIPKKVMCMWAPARKEKKGFALLQMDDTGDFRSQKAPAALVHVKFLRRWTRVACKVYQKRPFPFV
jgi:hypothetical protein